LPKLVSGRRFLRAFASTSYKTDSDSKEEASLIKFAVPYATDFVLGT
jgi:hypothetical protein